MATNFTTGINLGDFAGQTVTQFRGVVDVGKTFNPNTMVDPALGVAGFTARVRIDGDAGSVTSGGFGENGDLYLRSATNQTRIHFDGTFANGWFGGNGADGDIVLFPSQATDTNDLSQATIHLDGQAGEITLRNADFAEDFDIGVHASGVDPGTVMVLTDDGELTSCSDAYDRKVAGVISGAGLFQPGIIMDKQPQSMNRLPVALVGKVVCKVDAGYGAVAVGDLLTTSRTPGHAMRASDAKLAFGAVIGKAMQPLESGTDMISILIALQ